MIFKWFIRVNGWLEVLLVIFLGMVGLKGCKMA